MEYITIGSTGNATDFGDILPSAGDAILLTDLLLQEDYI